MGGGEGASEREGEARLYGREVRQPRVEGARRGERADGHRGLAVGRAAELEATHAAARDAHLVRGRGRGRGRRWGLG